MGRQTVPLNSMMLTILYHKPGETPWIVIHHNPSAVARHSTHAPTQHAAHKEPGTPPNAKVDMHNAGQTKENCKN
jgi:hypothetical protein